VRRVTGSLADAALIRESVQGADACIHVALGWGDAPLAMLEADTRATVVLLEACLAANVGKFVYTSSTAVLGPFSSRMDELSLSQPSDYYGATKAASEAFVLAVGARTAMKCNVIRPGYTFGNPVVEGATTQPDRRFHQIAQQAVRGEEIRLGAGDGTQFVWAGDLARLYQAVLGSEHTRETYFGLGAAFVSWQEVAELAIALSASRSRVVLEGTPGEPCLFDLGKIKRHFGLELDARAELRSHLEHLVHLARARAC
jgi:UDP-glucose 4-epimerase